MHIGYIEENERLDEAKDHLLQAKKMINNDLDDEAIIEIHLGEIATEEEQLQEALTHYQRVVELQPEKSESWNYVAQAHEELGNIEEAITNYQRAIELKPDNVEYYYSLSGLYTDNNQFEKAVKLLADGLVVNPDSIPLCIYLSALYMDKDDYQHAEIFLKKAERINPASELVQLTRPLLEIKKSGQELPTNPPRKFLKQKKERREEK